MNRRIGIGIGIALAAGFFAAGVVSGGEIPEGARASLKEALAAVREAKSANDYGKAERAFEEAVRIAPEWADAYAGMAALAEEMGKQVKAIRSYERYLELAKDAPDRDSVRSQIAKLRSIREAKRKVGMAGVTLVSLKDGLYIANVVPGSRIEKAGFRKGDRITKVNGQAIPGVRLEEFYRWVDGPNAEETSFRGRFSRHRWGYGRVKFTVMRGGEERELESLPVLFRSKVQEIEEDEVQEWASGPKPVIVSFWAHWCPPCRNFVQVLEDLAERYAGRVEFTMIDANSNPKAAERFQASKLPTTILFRDGKPAWRVEGFKEAKEIEEMLKREGVASGPSPAPGKGAAVRPAGGREAESARGPGGVCVCRVLPASAAQKAGVEKGDRIAAVDGEGFENFRKFAAAVRELPEGAHRLRILRDGKERESDVILPPKGAPARLGVVLYDCGNPAEVDRCGN